jgi:hypothetical protein
MVNERQTLFDDLSTKGAADGAGGDLEHQMQANQASIGGGL